jgi:hypothetical protein
MCVIRSFTFMYIHVRIFSVFSHMLYIVVNVFDEIDDCIRLPEINYKQVRGEGAKFNF